MTKTGSPVLGKYSGSGQDPHERGLRAVRDLKKMVRRERREHGKPKKEREFGTFAQRLNNLAKSRKQHE